LIGGATGRIGDPSGKKSERPVLTHVQENCDCIHKQLDLIFDNADKLMGNVSLNVKIMNNDSWFSNMGLLEFIGDYGRFARVSVMLNRDR
jgi:tyrosyl-tRNA synthetase